MTDKVQIQQCNRKLISGKLQNKIEVTGLEYHKVVGHK